MSNPTKKTQARIAILIVEDSPTQTVMLKYLLDQHGYLVTTAKNGREALELLEDHKPDLIISDINMPEMNGFNLCQHIKTNQQTQDIPVFLLTSLSNVQDVVDSLVCGADSFITKPYSEDYLIKNIERILTFKSPSQKTRTLMEVRINLEGKSRVITTNPDQTVSLLLSTFEAAVQRNDELTFSQEELGILNEQLEEKVKERAAELIAEITERKQAEEEVRRRLSELEVLYTSGLAIGQSLHPQEIGQVLIDLLSERLNWHHATLHLYDPKTETLELLAFQSLGLENEADRLASEEHFSTMIAQRGQGLTGWVIQHGQTVYCRDVTKNPRYLEVEPGIYSGIYVPLKIGNRTIGCLSVESEELDAFSETDEWLISTLAAQAASALENARLFDEVQRRLRHSNALRAIDQAITESTNLQQVLQIALRHVVTDLDVDAAVILLYDPKEQTLQFELGNGLRTDSLRFTRLQLGEGYAGRAALEKQTITIPDLQIRNTDFLRSPTFHKEGFTCYFGIPLIAKDEIMGVLEIFHRTALIPDMDWLGFMESLAGQIAIAIDNATLFKDLQSSNADLVRAYDATIEGWSRAMDLRDEETEGHTKRVTELTTQMAQTLGLSDDHIVHIRRGALLHDMGKLGVPDAILLKPGKLTDDEWVIMRQHPQHAYDMLHKIDYIRPALAIPYCHHEKWDGTGYPRGLKGEKIPIEARIFAIIDVYDALTSDRPYRKAWSKEQTIAHIQEQSGKHFDPDIVPVFLNM